MAWPLQPGDPLPGLLLQAGAPALRDFGGSYLLLILGAADSVVAAMGGVDVADRPADSLAWLGIVPEGSDLPLGLPIHRDAELATFRRLGALDASGRVETMVVLADPAACVVTAQSGADLTTLLREVLALAWSCVR